MPSCRGLTPRSWDRVELATDQPLPASPTSCSSGTKTSSRRTSLNSASPVIWTRGRTSTPSACMSTTRQEIPCCRLGASGSLRARHRAPVGELGIRGPHLVAGDPEPAGHRTGPGGQRGQVASGFRLAEQLTPELLGPEDGRQPALLLVRGAVGEEGGTDQIDPDAADQLGGPGPGHLLGDQKVLGGAQAAAAELHRPGHPHPPALGQHRLPAATERHHLGQVLRASGRLGPVLPRKVGHQPGPQFGAQVLLRRGHLEIHGVSLAQASPPPRWGVRRLAGTGTRPGRADRMLRRGGIRTLLRPAGSGRRRRRSPRRSGLAGAHPRLRGLGPRRRSGSEDGRVRPDAVGGHGRPGVARCGATRVGRRSGVGHGRGGHPLRAARSVDGAGARSSARSWRWRRCKRRPPPTGYLPPPPWRPRSGRPNCLEGRRWAVWCGEPRRVR